MDFLDTFAYIVGIIGSLLFNILLIVFWLKIRGAFNPNFERNRAYLLNQFKKLSEEYSSDFQKKRIIDNALSRGVKNRKDYKRLLFIYNIGDLRTQEEIDEYDYLHNREEYDSKRHVVNTFAFLIPFAAVFLLIFFGVDDFRELWFIGIPVALCGGLAAGIVGAIVGYSINISLADDYGLSENDPLVRNEKNKRTVAIIAGITSAVSIGKHTKKSVKDVANVDSWKEMK